MRAHAPEHLPEADADAGADASPRPGRPVLRGAATALALAVSAAGLAFALSGCAAKVSFECSGPPCHAAAETVVKVGHAAQRIAGHEVTVSQVSDRSALITVDGRSHLLHRGSSYTVSGTGLRLRLVDADAGRRQVTLATGG